MPPTKKSASEPRIPEKTTPADSTASTPANDRPVHASVIVRAASGKSVIKDLAQIAPQNVKLYLPAEIDLQEAARRLTALGFRVDLIASTSISGPVALFEKVFDCKIAPQSFPLFAGTAGLSQRQVFVADRPLNIPPQLQKLIESVDLAPAVVYQISAAPPPLAYDHMELPDDVARGMDAIKAHERGIDGTGVNLAMVDTGFMTPFHPYYAGKGYKINRLLRRIRG
jgi:hypothetical protein